MTPARRIQNFARHVAVPQLTAPYLRPFQIVPQRLQSTVGQAKPDLDAVVVGAGFAGIYLMKLLQERGFNARCYERGTNVGGVWNWNRYPGARCDIESMQYSYSFDPEIQQQWEWTERYASQPEILKYACHVTDKYKLRSHMQFNTEVKKMTYDEAGKFWTVETKPADGAPQVVKARFVVCATGVLSQSNRPEEMFEGIEDFKAGGGKAYHTGHWPQESEFGGAYESILKDKRVAQIGNGSSGIQLLPEIAKVAKHLTFFQRTPQYAAPNHNAPIDQDYVKKVKANYQARREFADMQWGGTLLTDGWDKEEIRPKEGLWLQQAKTTPEKERNEIYEKLWKAGGVVFYVNFMDILFDPESNKTLQDFMRNKIRSTVKDPEVAEKLSPQGYVLCKRPVVDQGFYEAFNRPNTTLVPLKGSKTEPPKGGEVEIVRLTKKGILTSDGKEHEKDVIVFAIGYDALTGAILNIDTTGAGGVTLKDYWKDGARTHMGLQVANFPNMFMITGPFSPSVLTNMIPAIEKHCDWVVDTLVHLRDNGHTQIATDRAAEDEWMQHQAATVVGLRNDPGCGSWYHGNNVAGKKDLFLPYNGGTPLYLQMLGEATKSGYKGFQLS